MKIFVLTFISSVCFSSFSYASSSERTPSFQFSEFYHALNPEFDWRLELDEASRTAKKSQILHIIMGQENGNSGDWQSDSDYHERRKMIAKICHLLKERKPNAPKEWQAKLPFMSKRLEEALYREANSKNEYLNHATLKRRLQDLAYKIGLKTSILECYKKIEEMKSHMAFDASEDQFVLISILKDKNQHQEDEIQEWCEKLEERIYESSASRSDYQSLVGLELRKRIVAIAKNDANEAMKKFQE